MSAIWTRLKDGTTAVLAANGTRLSSRRTLMVDGEKVRVGKVVSECNGARLFRVIEVVQPDTREAWRRYLAAVAGGVAGTGDIEGHATVLYAIEADVTDLTGAQASELLVRSFHEPAGAAS